MTDTDSYSRRTMLKITGAAGVTALAGCGGSGDGDGGDGGGGGDGDGAADADWGSVEEFYFSGQVSHWGAEEPAFLEGEENPTITLIEGQEYTFRWYNNDGITHNMEIRDENDEVIEDYQSEDVGTEGEEASIEGVTATQEMTTYICQYHSSTQVGDIEIQSE
ncbi:PKD domain-containing protein [Halosolutus halophilus]|uniref:PKD domain-containing protein n=1 Tax=Halosolutus halophilus TaxID=1552990 RepID=UPI0022350C00|nr:PKD domain-containing protein [Halosolutus halophilus]